MTRGEGIRYPSNKSLWVFVILAGVLSASGYIGYSIGIEEGLTSIVTPIAAAFPAVTVILAKVFLKEKLNVNQAAGISITISGIILLSF